MKMKTVSVDVDNGSIYETSVYKDTKGRVIKLVSDFSSGYFYGKVEDEQLHKLQNNNSFNLQEVFFDCEDYNTEEGGDTDYEFIGFTEEDEEEIRKAMEETFFEEVFEKLGFEYDDTITEFYGQYKLKIEEG